MRGMKVTVDAAMRARDVSRPRAEHEAMARQDEPGTSRPTEEQAAPALPAGPAVTRACAPPEDGPPAAADAAPKARRAHRRRRRR